MVKCILEQDVIDDFVQDQMNISTEYSSRASNLYGHLMEGCESYECPVEHWEHFALAHLCVDDYINNQPSTKPEQDLMQMTGLYFDLEADYTALMLKQAELEADSEGLSAKVSELEEKNGTLTTNNEELQQQYETVCVDNVELRQDLENASSYANWGVAGIGFLGGLLTFVVGIVVIEKAKDWFGYNSGGWEDR